MATRTNAPQKTLWIKLIEAKDLIVCDIGGSSDPYVRARKDECGSDALIFLTQVKLSVGSEKTKSRVIKKSLCPVWNQEFTLKVDGAHQLLMIRVYDKDFLTSDKMGNTFYSLENLDRGVETDVWLPLRYVKLKPTVFIMRVQGCVQWQCAFESKGS
jgi:Ca2+-dependent lipid-binding protein